MNKKKCSSCFKGHLKHGEKTVIYRFKGRTLDMKQPGLWCDFCEEGILNREDMKCTAAKLKAFRNEVKEEIAKPLKQIRLKLGFTQKEAGEVFGGGVNAFSRYERGESVPPLATEKLLRLLGKHPELVAEVVEAS